MDIKQIIPQDVPQIAMVHLRSFPKDHITTHFSGKMLSLFLLMLISFEPYNIVAFDSQNRVAGYLIAGYNYRKAMMRFLKAHYISVIKVLLFSPTFIPDKIKSFFIRSSNPDSAQGLCLDIIAVDPLIKQQGIGSSLLQYFEKMLIRDNVPRYILYVKKNNKSAVDFYMKRGFIICGTSGKSLIMRKEIH